MIRWSIIPAINRPDLTEAACVDALAQIDGDHRVLIIDKSQEPTIQRELKQFVGFHHPKALLWSQDPPLTSLSATWNQALDFVWMTGATEALVLNNDVRLHPMNYKLLSDIMKWESALLVTATGVTEPQFQDALKMGQRIFNGGTLMKGGPGFSNFLISRECHQKYRFDEALIPAFCEDVDLHRRMMLGGDGQRIFGTNVVYLHIGGQTVVSMSDAQRLDLNARVEAGSRAHYLRKWGGVVNQERFRVPFDPESDPDLMTPHETGCVRTPELFERERTRWNEPKVTPSREDHGKSESVDTLGQPGDDSSRADEHQDH